MELRHLRYFVAVAETGGFTAAAERMHTVQPSLSRQIRDLEAHIGSKLFARSTRHVELTRAGRAFLDEARLTLAQADRAVEKARRAARSESGLLTLGFVFGVEAEELTRVMRALQGMAGMVELAMHSQSSPALIAEVKERKIDAAFIRPSSQSQGLDIRMLRREPLVVALPAGHRLAGYLSIPIQLLADEPFISVTRQHAPVLYDATQDYVARHGVVLRAAYESENLSMAIALISSVGGIGLLPEHSVKLFPPGVIALPLRDEDPPIVELGLAWHPENCSDVLAAFLKAFHCL